MRLTIGIFLAALAMFFWGFAFYGSGLVDLTAPVSAAQESNLLRALKQDLPASGFYMLPDPDSGSQVAYAERMQQGPFARIHYHAGGVAFEDPRVMAQGFLHMLLTSFLLGLAFKWLASMADYAVRLKIALAFAAGAAVFAHLGGPIWWFETWGPAWKMAAYDFVAYGLAGAILGRFADESS